MLATYISRSRYARECDSIPFLRSFFLTESIDFFLHPFEPGGYDRNCSLISIHLHISVRCDCVCSVFHLFMLLLSLIQWEHNESDQFHFCFLLSHWCAESSPKLYCYSDHNAYTNTYRHIHIMCALIRSFILFYIFCYKLIGCTDR